ncbi:MAG: glycosyltransferase family 9 protein [Candidatus Latescibacterota bacterium]
MAAVAVIQTAFIGDVVLATPLFESARRSSPNTRIFAVVREGCENLLENNPFIDAILVWDKKGSGRGFGGILNMAGQLRRSGVVTALVPHRSARTGLAALFSGAKQRIGFAKGGGAVFHTVRVPWRAKIHEVERNLMLADALGWKTEGLRPAIFPDAGDRSAIDSLLRGIGPFFVLAPGSVWPTKMWPAESYRTVGVFFTRKGLRALISGGNRDMDVCGEVAAGIPGALDVSGKLTLRQSAELYRRSEFVLTGDTAPQHLAAAAGARVYSIFGPTVREFGFWPYSERGTVIEEQVSCRPCGIHGHRICPNRTHLCMRRITGEMVIGIIEGLDIGSGSK